MKNIIITTSVPQEYVLCPLFLCINGIYFVQYVFISWLIVFHIALDFHNKPSNLSSECRREKVKGGSPFGSTRLRSSTVLYHISGHLHNRQKQSKIKLNKVRPFKYWRYRKIQKNKNKR